jgi:rSAM/selenodomain-associated transferase 1
MVPVVVFARAPIPGRCKTRLAATVGPDRAAALSAAFVADTLRTLRAVAGVAPELHVADALEHPFFAATCARFDLPPPRIQRGHDLGERMTHALARDAPALLVGTDAPTLPAALVRRAIAAITGDDPATVLVPVADGGYVLVGRSRRAPSAFLSSAIRWSSPHALADTVRAARAAGLRVALTTPHYDVDDARDLALLRAQLALDAEAAPETAAVLRERPGTSPF